MPQGRLTVVRRGLFSMAACSFLHSVRSVSDVSVQHELVSTSSAPPTSSLLLASSFSSPDEVSADPLAPFAAGLSWCEDSGCLRRSSRGNISPGNGMLLGNIFDGILLFVMWSKITSPLAGSTQRIECLPAIYPHISSIHPSAV